MDFKLSAGDIERLAQVAAQAHSQGRRVGRIEGIEPVVQVLKSRPMKDKPILAVQLSDGLNSVTGLVRLEKPEDADSLTKEADAPFQSKNVLRLTDYTLSVMSSNNVISINIIKYTLIGTAPEFIGNPEAVKTADKIIGMSQEKPQVDHQQQHSSSTNTNDKKTPVPQQNNSGTSDSATVGPQVTIEMLSPFQNLWTIEARVTNKTDINEYSNKSGAGTWFAMTLMDKSGEIRCMAFNDACEKFFSIIDEGKVYIISKARISAVKRPMGNVQNEYQMTLEPTSIVELSSKQDAVPQVQYNFVPIAKLGDVPSGAMCDVLGVLTTAGEIREMTTRIGATKKRDVSLIDESSTSVQLTLWGRNAEQWTLTPGHIYAFKGLKVSDFGGRSLSASSASTYATDIDIPEAHRLEAWYQQHNQDNFTTLSNRGAGANSGFSAQRNNDELIFIEDLLKRPNIGADRTEFFSIKGIISSIMKQNFYYPACPTCNKKLQLEAEGSWRCERCQKDFPEPVYRYILAFSVMDLTGQITVNAFNEIGEKLLGISANDLERRRDSQDDPIDIDELFNKAIAKRYSFTIRGKQDTYGDNVRTRFTVQNFAPFNYDSELHSLVSRYETL